MLGVLIAKPLFRAMKSVGDGIVDASIRPAWKSSNENEYGQEMPSNSIAGRTSFRRGSPHQRNMRRWSVSAGSVFAGERTQRQQLEEFGLRGEKRWCERRDGVKVVCRGAEMLSSSHFINQSYLEVISLTTGICRPFPEVSSSFPKHWAMTLSREKPRHRRTPTSRY